MDRQGNQLITKTPRLGEVTWPSPFPSHNVLLLCIESFVVPVVIWLANLKERHVRNGEAFFPSALLLSIHIQAINLGNTSSPNVNDVSPKVTEIG
jgi:hypothetical protein